MRRKTTVRLADRLLVVALVAALGGQPVARLVVHEHAGGTHAHVHLAALATPGSVEREHEEETLPFARNDDRVEDWLGQPWQGATAPRGAPVVTRGAPASAFAHAHVVPLGVLATLQSFCPFGPRTAVHTVPPASPSGHTPRHLATRSPRAPPGLSSFSNVS